MTRNTKTALWVIAVVVIAVAAYGALTMPDDRDFGERVGDAASSLDEGVDDAARELEPRTPAERIGDEFEDRTDGSPQ